MNLINQIYIKRKRFNEDDILKLQKIINDEIDRRATADTNNPTKSKS